MKIKALGKNIFLEPFVEEEKPKQLILSTQETEPKIYTVLSVGDQVQDHLLPGDKVIIGYGLRVIEINDQKLYAIEECNILAQVLKDD